MSKKRRAFLKSATGLAAGFAIMCDPDAEARAAVRAPATPAAAPASPASLPMIRLGTHEVSRLIIGSNPIHGYSHFNRLLNSHMLEWSTPDHVCDLLQRCETQGINTWQFSHHERAMKDLGEHRRRGGNLKWILLSHREIEDDHRLIGEVIKQKPIGIVHHGGSAERKRREGKLGLVKDFLKAVRDNGVLVGLSTHDPLFLEQSESEQWDVDFYMTALYFLTRSPDEFKKMLGSRPLGEIYLPEDPPRMCAAIRKTSKPCLAYKVLAAGRLTDSPRDIDAAFRFALENIKPSDGIIIGMYPRYSDQVAENADRVRRFTTALPARQAARG